MVATAAAVGRLFGCPAWRPPAGTPCSSLESSHTRSACLPTIDRVGRRVAGCGHPCRELIEIDRSLHTRRRMSPMLFYLHSAPYTGPIAPTPWVRHDQLP